MKVSPKFDYGALTVCKIQTV